MSYEPSAPTRCRIQDAEILGHIARAQEQCAATGQPTFFKLRLCENQRKSLWGTFSAGNLLGSERGELTHGDGTGSYDFAAAAQPAGGAGGGAGRAPCVDAPAGWKWLGGELVAGSGWQVAREGCDGEGWQYAFVWGLDFAASGGARMFVRRRIWQRVMSMDPPEARAAVAAEAAAAADAGRGGVAAKAMGVAAAVLAPVAIAAAALGVGAVLIACADLDLEERNGLSDLAAASEEDAGAAKFEGDLDKYIAPGAAIHLGTLDDALHGIGSLLFGGEDAGQRLAQCTLEGAAAIEREFMASGSAEDRSNFAQVRGGTCGDGKTLDGLMAHESAKVAKLQQHHVLALRLYTTSSYAAINGPMRTVPPTQPHPFAATTFFVSEAIKKLRVVEARTPGGMQPRTLWRGVQGLSLTEKFVENGGTEFACMSTSASETTAAEFAKAGQNPMLFKYDTKNCADRGADIAYLSVYAHEAEVLYPPLTFLRFKAVQYERVGGVEVLVVSVDTQIVGN